MNPSKTLNNKRKTNENLKNKRIPFFSFLKNKANNTVSSV
jgi:hypothetical protein